MYFPISLQMLLAVLASVWVQHPIFHRLCFHLLLEKLEKRNRFTVYDVQASFVLPCYDYISWTGVAKTGEMVYYSVSENYGNGGNYISSIKPGESVQLNMAWIVNESDLKNLYLNVTGDGASYEFSEYILKKGLVDIRK